MHRKQELSVKIPEKVFVRYEEGARLYSINKTSFIKLAHDAGAVYKINQITLVNLDLIKKYMEVYHIYEEQ